MLLFTCCVAHLAFEKSILERIYEDKILIGSYVVAGISYVFK